MLLRELTLDDYEAILPLFRALDDLHIQARPDCNEYREDIYPKKAHAEVTNDPDCVMFGAFNEENTMIGLVRATVWREPKMVQPTDYVCLDNIYVLPEYRRLGIGRKLFQAVEQWSREKGAARLELHVWDFNQNALAMYRAMGMKPQRYVLEKFL